jgi:flagellar basal body rod protein FlgF
MVDVGLNGERLCANELTSGFRDRTNALRVVTVSGNGASVHSDFAPDLALNY